jgi:hypothetical protein
MKDSYEKHQLMLKQPLAKIINEKNDDKYNEGIKTKMQ